MNGFVTDGNDINCRECKYGDKCNVGRGHGYRVGSCIQFEVEKKQTNADRIRAMTDEELADFIGRCVDHEFQFECVCFLNQFGYCQYPTRGCNENALEWLKQEVSK